MHAIATHWDRARRSSSSPTDVVRALVALGRERLNDQDEDVGLAAGEIIAILAGAAEAEDQDPWPEAEAEAERDGPW